MRKEQKKVLFYLLFIIFLLNTVSGYNFYIDYSSIDLGKIYYHTDFGTEKGLFDKTSLYTNSNTTTINGYLTYFWFMSYDINSIFMNSSGFTNDYPDQNYLYIGADDVSDQNTNLILHNLNKTLVLTRDTQIQINALTSTYGAVRLVFMDNENITLAVDLTQQCSLTVDGEDTDFDVGKIPCCPYGDIRDLIVPYDFTSIDFKINDIDTQSCTRIDNISESIVRPFNRIGYMLLESTSNQAFVIDSINITQISESLENQVPSCSLEYNQTKLCLKEGEFEKNFYYYLDCFDIEEDKILYSIGESELDKKHVLQEETFSQLGNIGDFEFFERGNFYSNYTYQEKPTDLFKYHELKADGFNIVHKIYNSVTKWGYRYDYVITDTASIEYDLYFIDDDTEIDIIYYNGFLEVLNLSYKTDGTNTTISIDGDEVYNFNEPLYNGENAQYINTVLLLNPINNSISLSILGKDFSYLGTKQKNFSGVDNMIFYSKDNHILEQDFYVIDNLQVEGWSYFPYPTFQDSYTGVKAFNYGYKNFEVYVTDEVNNYFQNYETYSVKIEVGYCSENTEENINEIDLIQLPRALFKGFFDTIGFTGYLYTAWWWVYIVVLIILIITMKDFFFPLFLDSLIFFIASLIIGNSNHMVTNGILLIVSLIIFGVSKR